MDAIYKKPATFVPNSCLADKTNLSDDELLDSVLTDTNNNPETALATCLFLADKQNLRAIKCLGFAIQNGNNTDLLIDYCKQAYDQGSAAAAWGLALMHKYGLGVAMDIAAALLYYEEAHVRGLVVASSFLGDVYEKGLCGVDPSYEAALVCYEKADMLGCGFSTFRLATIYFRGVEGGLPDYKKAFEYFVKADQRNVSGSAYYVGIFYEFGYGVDSDYAKAAEYYKKDAHRGVSRAAFSLGNLYERGLGVPEDDAEAVRYFEIARDSVDKDEASAYEDLLEKVSKAIQRLQIVLMAEKSAAAA